MERRIHDSNSGRDSKPVLWIFEGANAFWIMGGLGFGLMLFWVLFNVAKWSTAPALLSGALPAGTALLYVLLLKQGKPPHFDSDMFEQISFRLSSLLSDRLGIGRPTFFSPPQSFRQQMPEEMRKRIEQAGDRLDR